jgi:uncharacterized OsmC-like protein
MPDSKHVKSSIERALQAMELRPGIARAKYRGTAVGDPQGLGCTYSDGKREIRMDVPKGVGGEDSAPSPGSLVRAALAGCVVIGLKMHAALREIPLGQVAVDLEVDSDDRADFGVGGVPPGYEAFRLRIRVEGRADPADIERLVADSLAMSPLVDLHARAQDITTVVEVGSLAASSEEG